MEILNKGEKELKIVTSIKEIWKTEEMANDWRIARLCNIQNR